MGYIPLKSSQVILLWLPFPQCSGKGKGGKGDREQGFLPGLATANIPELGDLKGCGYTKQRSPKAVPEVAGGF